MIIVDNYHRVASEATGDNYHLNLESILYLGPQLIIRDNQNSSDDHRHSHDNDKRWSEEQHVPRPPPASCC